MDRRACHDPRRTLMISLVACDDFSLFPFSRSVFGDGLGLEFRGGFSTPRSLSHFSLSGGSRSVVGWYYLTSSLVVFTEQIDILILQVFFLSLTSLFLGFLFGCLLISFTLSPPPSCRYRVSSFRFRKTSPLRRTPSLHNNSELCFLITLLSRTTTSLSALSILRLVSIFFCLFFLFRIATQSNPQNPLIFSPPSSPISLSPFFTSVQ